MSAAHESTTRVWLITGCSSGIGQGIALAALARGDQVIATARARSFAALGTLRERGADVLELDVTSSEAELQAVVVQATAVHGRIDVLVNNAGYGLIGAVEEPSLDEVMLQFNTNVFGGFALARAVLPQMRQRRSGTIVWIGSLTEWSAMPALGIYAATKAAVRAISQALDVDVRPLGLRSLDVEFGFTQSRAVANMVRARRSLDVYGPVLAPMYAALKEANSNSSVDPAASAKLLVDIVRGEGTVAGRDVPSVIGLGSDWHRAVTEFCEGTLRDLRAWEEVARSADRAGQMAGGQ